MQKARPNSFIAIEFHTPRIGLSAGLERGGAAHQMGPFIAGLAEYAQMLPGVEDAAEATDVDGFILETRLESDRLAERLPQDGGPLAVESVERIAEPAIRHHFLTRVFAFAELRALKENPTRAALADFQRRHKHVLMTYDQHAMRALGRIAAKAEPGPAHAAYKEYARGFREALRDVPTHASWANSAQHMFGHFKQKISAAEKAEFLAILAEYRAQKLPLEVPLAKVGEWCARYEYDYFADQTLLEPYPRELVKSLK